jgi:PAS domain S-box-containing protein
MKYLKDCFFSPNFWRLSAGFFLLAGFAYWFIPQPVFNNFKKEVSWATDITIAAVNPNQVRNSAVLLGDNNFYEDLDAKRLKEQLEGLGDLFLSRGVDALYLMAKSGNDVHFLVESTPFSEAGFVVPGSVYSEVPAALFSVFSDQKATFTDVYTDEYGTYFSEFTPVFDNDNNFVGVLGVDVDYNYYQRILARTRGIVLLIIFLFYVLAILSSFYLQRKKSAEKKVAENDKKVKDIIDSVPSGLISFNKAEEIIFWNHTCSDLFGLSSEEAIGKKIGDLVLFSEAIGLDSRRPLIDFHFFSDEAKIAKKVELKTNNVSGKTIILEVSFNFFEIGGEPLAIGLFEDVSLRRLKEAELETQKIKLEKLNDLMVNRELKMMELKSELSKIK